MRLTVLGLALASLVAGCDGAVGLDDAAVDPADAGAGPDAGGAEDAGARDAGADGGPALPDAGADAGVEVDAAAPPPCDWDDPRPPPAGVLWPDVLNATGALTLGGHGHDDGRGAVGFCAGTRVAGEPFYELVAVGFESDDDVNGDGDQADFLPVGFWRDRATFGGVGESAGRVNVYVEVIDEAGAVLDRTSAPDLRFVRTIQDGPTEAFPLDDKPDHEFQTNFAMVGGGARYAVRMDGASDEVRNLRLPVNHHVTFVVVFRRLAR